MISPTEKENKLSKPCSVRLEEIKDINYYKRKRNDKIIFYVLAGYLFTHILFKR